MSQGLTKRYYVRNRKIFEGSDKVAEGTRCIDNEAISPKRQQSSPFPGNLSVFRIMLKVILPVTLSL